MSQNNKPFNVGDTVLVYATVTSVSPDAWGPNTGHLYGVSIVTADAGENSTFASYAEPGDLAERVVKLERVKETGGTLLHHAPGSMTEHQYGEDNETWFPACPFCRALAALESQ
jgi:hypothetical protein